MIVILFFNKKDLTFRENILHYWNKSMAFSLLSHKLEKFVLYECTCSRAVNG